MNSKHIEFLGQLKKRFDNQKNQRENKIIQFSTCRYNSGTCCKMLNVKNLGKFNVKKSLLCSTISKCNNKKRNINELTKQLNLKNMKQNMNEFTFEDYINILSKVAQYKKEEQINKTLNIKKLKPQKIHNLELFFPKFANEKDISIALSKLIVIIMMKFSPQFNYTFHNSKEKIFKESEVFKSSFINIKNIDIQQKKNININKKFGNLINLNFDKSSREFLIKEINSSTLIYQKYSSILNNDNIFKLENMEPISENINNYINFSFCNNKIYLSNNCSRIKPEQLFDKFIKLPLLIFNELDAYAKLNILFHRAKESMKKTNINSLQLYSFPNTNNKLFTIPPLKELINNIKVPSNKNSLQIIDSPFKILDNSSIPSNSTISTNSSLSFVKIDTISIHKYAKKRTYTEINQELSNAKSPFKIMKIPLNKTGQFFIINNSNKELMTCMNSKKNLAIFIGLSNMKEKELDFIFDLGVCGKLLYSSELDDKFDLSIFNQIEQIVNNYYIYFSNFYFIILDDLINKRKQNYDVNIIMKKLNDFLNEKFTSLKSKNMTNTGFYIKKICGFNELYQCINNIQTEIKSNFIEKQNYCGIYKSKFLNEINNIISKNVTNNSTFSGVIKNTMFSKVNTYEGILLDVLYDFKENEPNKREIYDDILEIVKKVRFNYFYIF